MSMSVNTMGRSINTMGVIGNAMCESMNATGGVGMLSMSVWMQWMECEYTRGKNIKTGIV